MDNSNSKSMTNKGLLAFVCIAIVLIFALIAIVYVPKLISHPDDEKNADVQASETNGESNNGGNNIQPSESAEVTPEPTDSPLIIAGSGVVSCSNPLAAAIGSHVLESGGNAVDAAVAVSFALGVLEPYASGIGGGGGMLVYDPTTDTSMFYDYRDAAGADIVSGTFNKTGVPGFVKGMETVFQKYGTQSWGSLIQPSIEYADNGFAISASFARHLQSSHSKLSSKNNPQFFSGSRLLKEGETVYQKELANTYRLIQRYGSNIFYGKDQSIREHIIEALNYKLTDEDFDNYRVYERVPVEGTYRGNKIVSASAPFSGTTLIQMLEIAEDVELGTYDDDVLRYAKLMASISSVTLKDRRKNICDPAFHTVPGDLLTDEHIASLIEMVRSGNPEFIESDPEHESTTHISIIDKDGMMVSVTNTLSDFFGLGTYVDGFFLNNTMVTSSGDPNAKNYCVRGQRPRSFAVPTFIFCEDGTKLALGSSGGDRIPQVVMQIIIRYFNGETLQEACDKSRIVMNGVQYYMEDRDIIDPEGTLDANGFQKLYYSTREYFGAFNAVGIDKDGNAFGAADQRRNGSVESSEATENPDQTEQVNP